MAKNPEPRKAKPGQLTPEEIFDTSIRRSENLLKISVDDDESQRDLYRASIVMTISTLDAYLKSYLLDRLDALAQGSGELPDKLVKMIGQKNEASALVTAAHKNEFRHIFTKTVTKRFEQLSFQGESAIREAFGWIGITEAFKRIAKAGNLNEENLRADFKRFTTRRHQIVHVADYQKDQIPMTLDRISKTFAADAIKFAKRFKKAIERLEEK